MSNVLIIEDEDFLIRVLEDNLVTEKYAVEIARNGEEALEKIGKKKPDVILLDIVLPKKDGLTVLGEVVKNPEWRLIPVIILSNLAEDVTIKQALDMGADEYFVKS
jgi:DNA-binding response OmpR family regulator